MQTDRPQSAFDRDSILRTLWADPVAQLAFSLAPVQLDRGDEYVDLHQLASGVQVALRCMTPSGGVLSRKTVEPLTWIKLLGFIAA